MPGCLDRRLALDYLSDSVSDEIAEETEAHVQTCSRCETLLAGLAEGGMSQKLRLALAMPTAPPLPDSLRRLLPFPLGNVEPPAPGTAPEIPGYDSLRELGRGGTGVVYLARDSQLGRLVALKVILAGLHASREELARFRSEAMLISRLRHPNLVRVLHVGEHEGLPFCAMEYVEGGSLRERLSAGPLPAIEAAALTASLAEALQTVHAAGIVHRDLKPENVLLTVDGAPRIADFGLARDLQDEDRPTLTRTSQVVGTPRYMAPEQAAGRDERNGPGVDIHALGAILYELLTGLPPFRAPTLAQTLAQVVAQVPTAPRRLDPRVPIDLDTVCVKCLEKAPARRYESAGALAEDLRRFLDGRPVLARPVGPVERVWRTCARRPLIAGLAIALGLVVITLAVGGPIVAARQT
ncbi:MAG: serine/threonine-protein kinase, partial [Isosphaeraceae bacterium]